MSLRGCADLPALQELLQMHFTDAASGVPGLPAGAVDGVQRQHVPASYPGSAPQTGQKERADVAAEAAGSAALPTAMLQPTAKGAKRLQAGSYGLGDRRARLTVRGQKYYAGYFPTGAAAAQAEDLMVMWVHCSPSGWPEGWMPSECGLWAFRSGVWMKGDRPGWGSMRNA